MSSLLMLLLSGAVQAEPPSYNEAAHQYFTDATLIDQDGQSHRLYSDLMKGRTVIVTAFFSTCEASCPVSNRNLKLVADHFADRMGTELVFLTITLDPAQDTPGALKAHADALGAGAGWYLLTGTAEQVRFAQQKFGQHTDNKDNHQAVLAVGNDRTGLWKKALAMGEPADIIQTVQSVLDDSRPAAP